MPMPTDPKPAARIVASPTQWFALRAEKDGPCRVCGSPPPNELHHIVARSRRGDDLAENLAPVCVGCHDLIERRNGYALRRLHDSLTEAERTYCAAKLGGNALLRIFGEAVLA